MEGKVFETKKLAEEYVGGLSKPSKMPCPSYNLQPFVSCPMGRKLAHVRGSVCSECYGQKHQYVAYAYLMHPAWARRMTATRKKHFVAAMVRLLKDKPFFRWHDTGDVYSNTYMKRILSIAEGCPDTLFWLPTREYAKVTAYRRHVPENLRIRVSLPTINPPQSVIDHYVAKYGYVSTVVEQGATCRLVHVKDARGSHSSCGDCRDCWNDLPVIAYELH